MSQMERKTRADYIRYLWTVIRMQKQNQANTAKIAKYLSGQIRMTFEETESLLLNAVDDGLLEVNNVAGANRATKKNIDSRIFRIPNIENDFNNLEHDYYCYVCHCPKYLQKCTQCFRVSHQACSRVDFESTNYSNLHSHLSEQVELILTVPRQESIWDDRQDNCSIPDEESIEEIVIEICDEKPTINENTCNDNLNIFGSEFPNLKNETFDVETKDIKDVICIGEVRPPSRRRRQLSQSYKPESEDLNDMEIYENSLCTICRLMKKNNLQNPPNMIPEETNYLSRFVFNRIKSWISADTFSPLQFSSSIPIPSKHDLDLFQKLCFRFPTKVDDIDQKLRTNAYKNLTEFQCDIMDMQHCIGILYGSSSAEYEATKYLVSDCGYELSEIRQCRDCYRHSNEKSNKYWFCKPCVPRHELVFAKQVGYSYWPAKVIKVTDNQYDVRFFGGQHSRAVIDSNFVKSIDTELKLLKMKKSVSLTKALEELEIHQGLLQLSPGQFSYEAERTNPVQITGSELNTSMFKKKINNYNQKRTGKSTTNRKSGNPNSNLKQPPILVENNTTDSNYNKNATNSIIEIGSSQVISNINSKRKRNPNIPNVFEFTSSNDSEENTISDYLVGKRSKFNLSITGPKLDRTSLRKTDSKKKIPNSKKKLESTNQEGISSVDKYSSVISDQEHQSDSQEPLVSSTQEIAQQKSFKPRIKAKLEKPYCDAVETLRRQLSTIKNQSAANKLSIDTLQGEIETWQLKLRKIHDEHNKKISEIKKRQWCYFCEKEAIYHCCWNTAYCSTDCQQKHWQSEHKKACRRIR